MEVTASITGLNLPLPPLQSKIQSIRYGPLAPGLKASGALKVLITRNKPQSGQLIGLVL